MIVVVLLASMALAAVAAAGILRPFRSGGTPALERLADPLEDERTALIRTLGDLQDERRAGALSEEEYATLRAETEVRAVAVLRALEARDGEGALAAGLRDLRLAAPMAVEPGTAEPNGHARSPDPGSPDPRSLEGASASTNTRARLAVAGLGAALILVVVPLLIQAVSSRPPGASISGDTGIGGPSPALMDPALAALVHRVAQSPGDLSARLDLAARYVHDRRTGLAALQYTEVLRRDPRNTEANTGLAMIVYAAGRPADALYLVGRALAASPNDPEALFDRGVILLGGFHRPGDAATSLRAYLAAAPFGSHRQEAERLLAAIAGGATAAPTSGPSSSPSATATATATSNPAP